MEIAAVAAVVFLIKLLLEFDSIINVVIVGYFVSLMTG